MWLLGMILLTTMSFAQLGWMPQSNPLGSDTLLGKIQFVSSTEGWISADHGRLLHSTDAGTTWNVVNPFPNDTLYSFADPSLTMWWVNPMHGWKINWFGTGTSDAHGAVMQRTTDGGATWEKNVLSNGLGDMGVEVQFVNESNGFAIIYNPLTHGAFLRSSNGGATWDTVAVNGAVGLFAFVDASNGWSITRYSSDPQATPEWSITHTTDGGNNWSVQYTDVGNTSLDFTAIQFTDLNNGWVVGRGGKIFKTTNGGSNWTPVTNTGLSSDSYSKCLFFVDANTGWIGSSMPVLVGITPQREILHTTDGGSSWSLQYPDFLLPPPGTNTATIFGMFFLNSTTGWFTADYGIIGHTVTGGTTAVGEAKNDMPGVFALSQNYPNPFNPSTIIAYTIAGDLEKGRGGERVRLSVYDVLGREVAVLVDGVQTPGEHRVTFGARTLASGIYYCRLIAGGAVQTRKMALVR